MKICWAVAIYLHQKKFSALILTIFTVTGWMANITQAHAAPTCKPEVARVVSMQGTIEIRRTQENVWQQAGMEVVLCAGDMIRARSQSRAALRLSNNSMLRLDQKTSITFPAAQEERGTSLLDLFEGAIHIITRTPQPFKIRTPFVNASVEGTEFVVGLREDNTEVVVYEGKVSVSNELGSILLHDHEAAVTYKGQAPRKEIIIRPADAVQWALYYPVVLNYWQDGEAGSSALIRQASHLLTVGQADEAKEIIQQILQLEPNNSNAHALLAIIALVQNEKDQALELASKSVALDQESTAGYLALSYTQQAHFEIEAALESLQKALTFDVQNALIWARLAELQMSTGYLERALDAAKLAVNLDPGLAKTQTVLGFAHLLQIDTQTAKDIFHRAIALDQADPTPRLGLGLALIREGELEAGRIELEIAASLDPANSLIRSYLGKAYFEEKRYPLASTQFDLAKERDPKDPTPWFYDAIQKQTQNRPVEALRDIQKSIELNNNRAVYRSKFLLDHDEAARGSSLARIFENLGFERRAVMETAKSLSFDPANYSAHRFLSDTYANIPRHEIARASELLQAQLLQPINVNPVQPHSAVADLNIVTNSGPSAAGFNEFTPLMERNKPQLVASGIVGSNNTLGNEVVASALYNRASISAGQFHYESDGFRTNNDQRHNIYNIFMQYALTEKLNIQAEVRARETNHGNLITDFDNDSKDLNADNNRKRRGLDDNTVRVGARYALSPKQDIIISTMFADRHEKQISSGFFNPATSNLEILGHDKGYQTEAQYQFRERNFNALGGGGSYQIDSKDKWHDKDITTRKIVEECIVCESFNRKRDNGYIYTYTNFNRLNLTLGGDYTSFKENAIDIERFNPKLGLQLDIFSNLRLRLAWFKTIKSALISNQTLEPTQVAGFNQFFDDVNGTKTRRMGIGIDTHINKIIFGGLEISRRDIDVPSVLGSGATFEQQQEKQYRAYLYLAPHINWVVRSEVLFDKFSRAITPAGPHQIDTLSTPVNISYFNQKGVFSTLTGTFVRQEVDREYTLAGNKNMNHENEGIEKFFLLDMIMGYRFPNRMGILSLEGRNLLDQDFLFRNINFQAAEPTNSRVNTNFIPMRTFFARLTFNF
ncbi:FecR domain-containing protein [Nitrosomonas oligotropha]|uniref:FecR family protein n=1 Tax=Nitrosomonas oligotropha TaxID=42354 RepID=A0A1H8UIZ9_9PROT|nr:tetratricopeptide repeat protein [Nitrosomonas oligotropha]SDX46971.1 FecR family protein [Nitrosomonas oligotropha]SEP02844.1 FecR family protein [Nitrosomonas oligotropha]